MNSQGAQGPIEGPEDGMALRHGFIASSMRAGGALAAVVAVMFYAGGELPRWFDPEMEGAVAEGFALAEIAAQLRVPFGQVLLVCALPLVLLRARGSALAVLTVACLCLGPSLWLGVVPRPEATTLKAATDLRVVCANVLYPNEHRGELLDAVAAQDADVIGLEEVTVPWRAAALARFAATHPHTVSGCDQAQWDSTAIGQLVLSRYPIQKSTVIRDGVEQYGRPVVEAVIDAPGGPVTVQVAHPERPGRAWRLTLRTRQLDALAARPVEGARVVMGDLNTASSSPLFRRFVAETGLVDTRRGFGRQATWRQFPGHVPRAVARTLRPYWSPSVAIDHVLVSDELVAVDREVFKLTGSDHLGVVCTLRRRR